MQLPKEDAALTLLSLEPGSLWLRLRPGEQSNSEPKRRVWLHPASLLPREQASALRRRREEIVRAGKHYVCPQHTATGRETLHIHGLV